MVIITRFLKFAAVLTTIFIATFLGAYLGARWPHPQQLAYTQPCPPPALPVPYGAVLLRCN